MLRHPTPKTKQLPPLYDYSNDSYLETPVEETDKGLQLRKDDTGECNYVPTGVTTPQSQVHRWVTDPFAKNFKMTKSVTLEFYTRSLSDELYTGKLCVYLFKRHEVGTPPVATDTLLVDSSSAKKIPSGPTPRKGKPSPTGRSSTGTGSG